MPLNLIENYPMMSFYLLYVVIITCAKSKQFYHIPGQLYFLPLAYIIMYEHNILYMATEVLHYTHNVSHNAHVVKCLMLAPPFEQKLEVDQCCYSRQPGYDSSCFLCTDTVHTQPLQ